MKTNYLTTILVLITISLLPAQSYAKKPAEDVDCAECVDTADIADGAVTTEKLSTDLQIGLGQKTVVVLDANDNQVGTLFDASSNSVARIIVEKDGEIASLAIRKDGYFESDFAYTQDDCLGIPIMDVNRSSMITHIQVRGDQGYVPSGVRPADSELIYSYWYEGECIPVDPPITVGDAGDLLPDVDGETAVLYDLSIFTPPFRYATSP